MSTRRASFAVIPPLFALLSLAGCGTPSHTPMTFGPEGGFLRVDGVGIDIPPGAVDGLVELRIERIAVPSGHRASGGAAFRFHPEGLRFRAPITVRFDLASSDHDVAVFWSRAEAPDTVAALATRIEGAQAVATVDHFSIGFAGWEIVDEPDAGIGDAGAADSGSPDAASDAGAGSEDAGAVTGVTCIVQERNPDCTPTEPTTYTDVPFGWYHQVDEAPVSGITSPLNAFRLFYSSVDSPRFAPGDDEGTGFVIGDGPVNATRAGLVLTVDVNISRSGTACIDTPPHAPIVSIRCTGSAQLPMPQCLASGEDPSLLSPLSCSVARRDSTCIEHTSTETPRFWTTPGTQGPDAELWIESPAFAEVFGADGRARFYREAPCDSYVRSVATFGSPRFYRADDQIFVEGHLSGTGAGTCRDSLGNPQPTVRVSCSGRATISAAP